MGWWDSDLVAVMDGVTGSVQNTPVCLLCVCRAGWETDSTGDVCEWRSHAAATAGLVGPTSRVTKLTLKGGRGRGKTSASPDSDAVFGDTCNSHERGEGVGPCVPSSGACG